MFCSLFPFNMPLVFGAAMLWLEISTIFVAFRWMMFFHDIKGDWRQHINTFLCAVTFILFRTVFQLYAVIFVGLPFLYETFFVETGTGIYYYLYLALLAEFFIAVLINIIMNCYWSLLVLLQILRIFTKGQAADSEFVNNKIDKVDKKERVKNPKHVELAEIPEYEQHEQQP